MPRDAPLAKTLALGALALALAAAACEREQPAPVPAGPPYSPATADALKALAADCEFQTHADGGETRSCKGRQATMRIEIDASRRLRELDTTVLASTGVSEAWTLLDNVLPAVAGPAVVEAARDKLRGEPAGDVVAGVRIATAIDGQRYTVKLTWGR
jgi:hypothetical protein